MDDLDLLDEQVTENKEVPQVVKTLSILSIVGNSLWLLIFLIAAFYVLAFASAFGGLAGGLFAGFFAIAAIIFFLILMLHVLGLIAAIRMMNGSKGAFILYAVTNGLWSLLCLMSAVNDRQDNQMFSVFCGLVSIGFIVMLGIQMKNMPIKK
ncbi:MAG: hypothetical protein ABJG68_06655 [Crocinitomicaceae bacterium]